jgi:hypothetical protein
MKKSILDINEIEETIEDSIMFGSQYVTYEVKFPKKRRDVAVAIRNECDGHSDGSSTLFVVYKNRKGMVALEAITTGRTKEYINIELVKTDRKGVFIEARISGVFGQEEKYDEGYYTFEDLREYMEEKNEDGGD